MDVNNNTPSSIFLTQEDIKSLKDLGNYESGYLDIDIEGHILSNYPLSLSSSIWRKSRIGYPSHSSDIAYLDRLFFKYF